MLPCNYTGDLATAAAYNFSFNNAQGYLATMNTAEEHNFIVQNWRYKYTQEFFMGGTGSSGQNRGTWKWLSENVTFMERFIPKSFTFFKGNEPNSLGNEIYLTWLFTSGWNDIGVSTTNFFPFYMVEYECSRATTCYGSGECSTTNNYTQPCVCDFGFKGQYCNECVTTDATFPYCYFEHPTTKNRYVLVQQELLYYSAFTKAYDDSPNNQYYLASITSEDESNFIKSVFPGKTFWIGGADYKGQGTWSWIGGPDKPYVFYHNTFNRTENWYSNFTKENEPKKRLAGGIMFQPDGSWRSVALQTTASYLIEYGGSVPELNVTALSTPVFNPVNKHFYQFLSRKTTWAEAYTTAASTTFKNMQGYLATITSPQEHNFLYSSFGYRDFNFALGGSGKQSAGIWQWQSKENSIFYTKKDGCLSFCLFGRNEPNDDAVLEGALLWRRSNNALNDWTDFSDSATYLDIKTIVEFDCTREAYCYGHGECAENGICLCDSGYTGEQCNVCASPLIGTFPNCFTPCNFTCENGGSCIYPGVCNCAGTGYIGDYCTAPTPAPCKCNPIDECCNSNCQFIPSTALHMCRPKNSAYDCDEPEYCNGISSSCPPDEGKSATFVCRPSTSICDLPEVCGRSKTTCPQDVIKYIDECGVCGGDNSSCTSEGVCGDNFCNAGLGENCATCVIDCGHCIIPSACDGIKCVHGKCDKGICQCEASWSGPLCDNAIVPIPPPVFNNDTTPGVSLPGEDKSGSSVTFSISITKIQEISAVDGQVQKEHVFDTNNINTTQTIINGTTAYTVSQELDTGAYIVFTFFIFDKPTTIVFANQSTLLSPNTLKSTVQIVNWPFSSLKNTLSVWTSLKSSEENEDECDEFTAEKDESSTVKWLNYKVNGVTLFAEFLNRAEIDGKNTALDIRVDDQSKFIVFKLPFFWQFAAIDPNYSFLVDPIQKEGCGDTDKVNKGGAGVSRTLILAVSVGVGGAILVAGAVSFIIMRQRRVRRTKEFRRRNTVLSQMGGSI